MGTLPSFGVGEYMMVARVNKRSKLNRYVSTWTSPWPVVSATGGQHVYGVENIVTGERKEVQVARMSLYVDYSLAVTAELLEVFATLKHWGVSGRRLFGPSRSAPTATSNGWYR